MSNHKSCVLNTCAEIPLAIALFGVPAVLAGVPALAPQVSVVLCHGSVPNLHKFAIGAPKVFTLTSTGFIRLDHQVLPISTTCSENDCALFRFNAPSLAEARRSKMERFREGLLVNVRDDSWM